MDGDTEANFLHYAIQKLHWSPSRLEEWLDAEPQMKALYYASTELKSKHDKEEAEKIRKTGRKSGRRKR